MFFFPFKKLLVNCSYFATKVKTEIELVILLLIKTYCIQDISFFEKLFSDYIKQDLLPFFYNITQHLEEFELILFIETLGKVF